VYFSVEIYKEKVVNMKVLEFYCKLVFKK